MQHLWDVYTNVKDLVGLVEGTGASRSEAMSNAGLIQSAISSGWHVLFPAGTFTFFGVLMFPNADQRVKFLAHAILQPYDAASYILITGERQTFEGLRIEARTDREARSPLLEIYGASGLSMTELRVSVSLMDTTVSGPRAAVRLMGLTGARFIGGRISGGAATGTVGIWLAPSYDDDIENDPNPNPGDWNGFFDEASAADRAGRQAVAQTSSGASDVTIRGMRIVKFGWAVRLGCVCHDIRLIDCRLVKNVDGAVVIRDDLDVLSDTHVRIADPLLLADAAKASATQAVATGLTVMNCHMGGASPPQYVYVQGPVPDMQAGGSILGGAIVGCTFGSTEGDAEADDSTGATDDSTAPAQSWGLIGQPGAPKGSDPKGEGGSGDFRNLSSGSVGPDSAVKFVGVQPAMAKAPLGGSGSKAKSSQLPPGKSKASTAAGQAKRSNTVAGCIFQIDGSLRGVFVAGCRSEQEDDRLAVWAISESASILASGDTFNAWTQASVATGDNAKRLPRLTGEAGDLAIHAHGVRFEGEKIGFYEGTPAGTQSFPYLVADGADPGKRTLRIGSGGTVLGQVLVDLMGLGLISGWRRPGP